MIVFRRHQNLFSQSILCFLFIHLSFGCATSYGSVDTDLDGRPDIVDPFPKDISLPGYRPEFTLYGDRIGESFGRNVKVIGDVNGDNIDDFAIAAPFRNVGRGRVSIFSGNSAELLWSFDGKKALGFAGLSISTAERDFNGDKIGDILVGAPGEGNTGGPVGVVYLLSGKNGDILAEIEGKTASDHFGGATIWLDDVNKDGKFEFAVGALGVGDQSGSVVIIDGAELTTIREIKGLGETSRTGHSLAMIDDLNADGIRELAVGSIGAGKRTFTPRVTLHDGATGSLLGTILGEVTNSRFGHNIGTLSDINGDGKSEIVILDNIQALVAIYDPVSLDEIWRKKSPGAIYDMGSDADVNTDGLKDITVSRQEEFGLLHNSIIEVYDGRTGSILLTTVVPERSLSIDVSPRNLNLVVGIDGSRNTQNLLTGKALSIPISLVDTDRDGIADRFDAFPNDSTEWLDTDGDRVGNNADTDDDNDGIDDEAEVNLYLGVAPGSDPLDDNDPVRSTARQFLMTTSTSHNLTKLHILNSSPTSQLFTGSLYSGSGNRLGSANQLLTETSVPQTDNSYSILRTWKQFLA